MKAAGGVVPVPYWRGPALRALAWFWAALVVVVGGTAVTLQSLGPPSPPTIKTAAAPTPIVPAASSPQPAATAAAVSPEPVLPAALAAAPALPARSPGDAIVPPDPALEEPTADYPGALPRIGADHRLPLQVYAAAVAPADARPRIAILLTGLGMLGAEDADAVRALPSAMSAAISPYAYHSEPILQQMRAQGRESFLSLPMEPRSFATDDAGSEAMLTGNSDGVNLQRLRWAMSRLSGYVGATPAMGALRGERFAASATQMAPILRDLAARGLMYIDSRPNAKHPPGVVGRSVDVVVDAPAVRTEIDAKLAQLETIARAHGSALGVAGPPHPVTVARLAAWGASLASRGFVLVPVSALATPTVKAERVSR